MHAIWLVVALTGGIKMLHSDLPRMARIDTFASDVVPECSILKYFLIDYFSDSWLSVV